MAQIVQAGTINTTALVVPDLYVQIVPPSVVSLNGVPTNVVGVVGSAAWGPVNQARVIGTMQQYAIAFGAVQNRKFDMGTHVAIAVLQGAQAFRCVRVTDGTDTAAVGALANFLTFTAIYTGSVGNLVTVAWGPGSKANTKKLTVAIAGQVPEVYDNLAGSGATLAQAAAFAINSGVGARNGAKSGIVIAQAVVTGTVTPADNTSVTLTGGTDGATSVNAQTLVGQDAAVRTGMYALRGQGVSIALLADADDSTTWTIQAAFGQPEGIYMIATGPSGDTIANAQSVKQAAGLDTPWVKLMFGDWLLWQDAANQIQRFVSPQGFAAGRLANLAPQQSSGNKPLYGIIGSQRSLGANGTYSTADLAVLLGAGIDVICNPVPAGSIWGVRAGHNSSSSSDVQGDNYTRMTNYIAATIAAAEGVYVNRVITPSLLNDIRTTQINFLDNLLGQGILSLGLDNSLPYSVVCDASNNPFSRTSLGYTQCDIQVRYSAINEKFIVNLQGGQTVQVQQRTLGGVLQPILQGN